LYIGQRLYRTRITPEADVPSEHLTDRTDLNGLVFILKPNWFSENDTSAFANAEVSFNVIIRKPLRVEYIIRKNPFQSVKSLSADRQAFDPRSILFFLVLACPGWMIKEL
jgi:hypothetical protein